MIPAISRLPPVPTGRYAPSPTGSLHVGNLRTALLAWLFARSAGARFLMRVEDLDTGAATFERAREQLADLKALGLDWDGEPVYQSDRRDRYAAALAELEAASLLYPCFCTRREVQAAAGAPHGEGRASGPAGAYPGTCRDLTEEERTERVGAGRNPALRVRADAAVVEVQDRLCGPYRAVVDDFVVRRGDGAPAYQLAVVVDDDAQGIGEVVRGDDLLASTPRQVWLAHRLGLAVPDYAHVPLVRGPDGERLAKRHGAVSLTELGEVGVRPEQLLADMAVSLGLAEPDEPVLSPADLLHRFDPDRLPRTPWTYPPEC